MSGFIGLFVGAVILALGYRLFMAWLGVVREAITAEEIPDSNHGRPRSTH